MPKRLLIEKIIVILIILMIPLIGIGVNSETELICNLKYFDLPSDVEFINLIVSLDTPKKICDYMKANFEYEEHVDYSLNPYEAWKLKKVDCNDYATFAIFIAKLHGYEVYQVFIRLPKEEYGKNQAHMIAVYVKDGRHTFSDCELYFALGWESIKDIMAVYYEWEYYKVFDYNMNLVGEVVNKKQN